MIMPNLRFLDEENISILCEVLGDIEATLIKTTRGHAGSQEIIIQEFKCNNKMLVIEQETYIGISIIGDDEIIKNLLENDKLKGRICLFE